MCLGEWTVKCFCGECVYQYKLPFVYLTMICRCECKDFNTCWPTRFLIKPQCKKSCLFSCFCTTCLALRGWDHHLSVALPWCCPSSCPVDVCLCRTVACAVSQGAEADVEGFTHLKALEGRPRDERWLLGGREGGLGLNPSIPPFSSSSPLPSPPLAL